MVLTDNQVTARLLRERHSALQISADICRAGEELYFLNESFSSSGRTEMHRIRNAYRGRMQKVSAISESAPDLRNIPSALSGEPS